MNPLCPPWISVPLWLASNDPPAPHSQPPVAFWWRFLGQFFEDVAAHRAYFLITISTRRFFWRPSGSSEPSGF